MPDVHAQPPRHLINISGESFSAEIDIVEPLLAALPNDDRKAYRNSNAQAIAQHTAARLLIVAGPGSGKSYLFLERIRYWLPLHEDASIYVSSFVRKLVNDLQSEIATKLSEDHQNRVTATTLHGLARSVVERNHGTAAQRLAAHIKVIAGRWSGVVWEDVQQFHPGSSHSFRTLERQFHTEEFKSDDDWPAFLATYYELCRFYNAVGFADMVYLARQAIEENPSLNRYQLWIIDEFQDFNQAEEHFIRTVCDSALGVLLAGDDEQALYQQLKASHPEIIVSYYNDAGVTNAMLPYCSRCSYYVCLAAAAFITAHRDTGAIRKIYLPLTTDESDPKLQVVAAAAPSTAVDYIEKFITEHRTELEEHRAAMEAGTETDPFLLILTPEKTARFYQTGGAQGRLKEIVEEWAHIRVGHSADYWKVMAYCTVAWHPEDNFALRKVLAEDGVTAEAVHPLLLEALEQSCQLSEVANRVITAALEKSDQIARIVERDDLTPSEKVAEIARLLTVQDQAQLASELEVNPISIPGTQADDEGEEAIETAGAMAPVEMMTLVGAKGLSAVHVIVVGCDDVNLGHTSALTFFVALTRARRSLHLLTALKAGGAKAMHPFVLEIPEQYCKYMVHKKTGPEELASRAALVQRVGQWARLARGNRQR